MSTEGRKNAVLIGLTLLFLGLAGAFLFDLWGRPLPVKQNPPTDPQFTNVATVRLSAAELIRTGGDTSGLSCHGPTYRDWEIGIHGRKSGYWDKRLGAAVRQDCTSCHDPHSPAFPSLTPGPGPNPLHPTAKAATRKDH